MSPNKSCGSCTFCCKVMEITELSKPGGVWCDHCKPGKGCSIYGAHPPSCQGFACQWLLEPGMPDAYRPDRSKVVLAYDPDGSRLVAHCDPAAPLAWRNEPVHSLLKQRAAATWNDATTIFAKAGPRVWAIAPNADADLGPLDPRSPYVITKRRDGTISVEVHPPVPDDEDMDAHLESRRASFRKASAK